MQTTYKTERLHLRKMDERDSNFIIDLLNTEGWIKYIGQRNIKTQEDALAYIHKITTNVNTDYRVVTLQDDQTAIGLVTLIKRDYLDHNDVGFAFLPAYQKAGYAAEATKVVLNDLLESGKHSTILATTTLDNSTSMQLLKKLGFVYSKQIIQSGEALHLFSINQQQFIDKQSAKQTEPSFTRTDSDNKDFISLVSLLDADLAWRDGDEHAFYAQFNKIAAIRNVIVCYKDGEAVACGAFKEYDATKVEIKRMFVLPQYRGYGIAKLVLKELEHWAAELKFTECVLETGKKQPEAISLYSKAGYSIIANYGQYLNIENSVCMMKPIS